MRFPFFSKKFSKVELTPEQERTQNIEIKKAHDDGFWSDATSSVSSKVKELKESDESFFEAYKRVVWLRRSVDLRASLVSSVPLRLFRTQPEIQKKLGGINPARYRIKKILEASRTGDIQLEKRLMEDMEPVNDHPVLDLLADVNPLNMNRSDLWRNTEQNIQIYGAAYWYLEYLNTNTPQEIYLLCNKHLQVIPAKNPSNFIQSYNYQIDAKRKPKKYLPEKIVSFKINNPDNPFTGLSPIVSVLPEVNSSLAAKRWNFVFFKNAVKPIGFIELPPGEDVGPEDVTMIREAINAVHQGIENQSQVGVLWNGAKFRPLFDSSKDADWVQLQKDNREAFTACQGVPLFLVSSHETASYASAVESVGFFWTGTIIPQLQWFEEVLFWGLLPLFPDTENMILRFDFENVPALESLAASKMERIGKATGTSTLTPNEGRKETGRKTMGPGGDVLYGEINKAPLFEPTGETQPEPEPEPASEIEPNEE